MAIERLSRQEVQKEQNISLVNRENLAVSGVCDVLNFSENTVELETELGILKILGSKLKIISVSTGEKTAEIIGKINSMEYRKQHEKKSLWQSVFK